MYRRPFARTLRSMTRLTITLKMLMDATEYAERSVDRMSRLMEERRVMFGTGRGAPRGVIHEKGGVG
jgi:hypothetical protein